MYVSSGMIMVEQVFRISLIKVKFTFFNSLILQVENVKLLDRYANRKAANGTLYLTATHLIYVDASSEVRKETWVCVILGACLNTNMSYKVFSYAV